MASVLEVPSDRYGELSEFLASFEAGRETPEIWRRRFDSWWVSNPAAGPTVPRGWLLEDNRQIVGFLGNIPTLFQLEGDVRVAFNPTTWRVREGFRHLSLKLMSRLIEAADDTIIFNTSPKPNVVPILERFGFEIIPRGGSDALRRPCSIIALDFAHLMRIGVGRLRLNRWAAGFAAPLLHGAQALRLRRLSGSELTVHEITQVDDRFDGLWQRTRETYANTAVRTARALDWYCFGPSECDRRLFGCYRGEELLGYAIFWARDDHSSRKLECLDLWQAVDEPGVVQALLAAIRAYGKQRGFHVVILPHFHRRLDRTLRRLGLFTLRAPRKGEYVKMPRRHPIQITDASAYLVEQGDMPFFA